MGPKYQLEKKIREEKNRVRMTIFGSKIGFIHCIGNSLGEETTEDGRLV